MVYLERDQLEALRSRARAQRIFLAEAVRRAVGISLEASGTPPIPPSAYRAIVAMGASGKSHIGRDHDAELAKALRPRRRGGSTSSTRFAVMERLGIDEAFAFDAHVLVYRFGPRRQRAIRRLPR